jgi:hypothetical protein
MSSREALTGSLQSVDANENFTQAVMLFDDRSRLCFCHTVDERWVRAIGCDEREEDAGLAGRLLSAVTTFRLNAKHLDIQFADGSRWDHPVQDSSLNSQ